MIPLDLGPKQPLVGGDNEFRLRQGDWRIVYVLDRAAETMTVTVVDTRGGVYK